MSGTHEGCVHELFEAQVERTPDAVALVYEGGTLTYRELNERANRLAHRLRADGVGPDVPVAFYLERTDAPVVAILGILKAGGFYVPIDPGYPEERRAWIIADSLARIVITSAATAAEFASSTVTAIAIDGDWVAAEPSSNPGGAESPDNLAYVIYTSGSTGRPKGSLIPHRNVVRLMRATEHWFHFGPADCWTVFHSFAFDFTVWELWGALLYGGRAIVVSQLTSRAPEEMLDLICTHGVTVLNQTPSAFRQLMHAATSGSKWPSLPLRWIIFGGEALDIPSLSPWFKQFGDTQPKLVNMYGITETTVHVTYRPLSTEDTRSVKSVIGEPISDLTLRVLDGQMNPAPIGVAGELYIGGAGASRGYLGLPALTAERFVPDPFASAPGARLYRSGDLGRRISSEDVEYLGRADFQVKIRGFRIEIGEIEHAVATHPRVRDVVVMAREDIPGEKRLVAYVVVRGVGEPLTSESMREYLRPVLPSYMVPSALVVLDTFPLTPNGKLDRTALPRPRVVVRLGPHDAPSGPIESAIASTVCELLDIEKVGATHDLFQFGLHSLLLLKLRVHVQQSFGVDLPLRELFKTATVRRVADLVVEAQTAALAQATDLDALLAEVAELSEGEIAKLLATEG